MRRSPRTTLPGSKTGGAPSARDAACSGKDASIRSAVRNTMGARRGVPAKSVATLTTPTAAWRAKRSSGRTKLSAMGTPSSAPPSRAGVCWLPAAKTAAPAMTTGPPDREAARAGILVLVALVEQQDVEADHPGHRPQTACRPAAQACRAPAGICPPAAPFRRRWRRSAHRGEAGGRHGRGCAGRPSSPRRGRRTMARRSDARRTGRRPRGRPALRRRLRAAEDCPCRTIRRSGRAGRRRGRRPSGGR